MKKIVWLLINKKNSFANSNGFLKSKKWIGCLIRKSQNGKNYIDSHSKFVIGIQYMMKYKMINSYHELFLSNP
jgi:hypothetical protein